MGSAASDEHHQRAHRAQQLSDRARKQAPNAPPPNAARGWSTNSQFPPSPTLIAKPPRYTAGPMNTTNARPISSAYTPRTNAGRPNRRGWPGNPMRATLPPTVAM